MQNRWVCVCVCVNECLRPFKMNLNQDLVLNEGGKDDAPIQMIRWSIALQADFKPWYSFFHFLFFAFFFLIRRLSFLVIQFIGGRFRVVCWFVV